VRAAPSLRSGQVPVAALGHNHQGCPYGTPAPGDFFTPSAQPAANGPLRRDEREKTVTPWRRGKRLKALTTPPPPVTHSPASVIGGRVPQREPKNRRPGGRLHRDRDSLRGHLWHKASVKLSFQRSTTICPSRIATQRDPLEPSRDELWVPSPSPLGYLALSTD
jgi:hypothetical protein